MTSTDTLGGGVGAANDDDVAAFAAAVRSQLDDLPPDEVEDLVDGLEADLIERREDSDEPLGDPRVYAAELRAAAGLPPRDERLSGEWFGGFKRLWRNGSAWVRERREHPVVGKVLDFLVALRPVWWVLRGWVAFAVLLMFGALTPVPDTALGWAVLAGFVVVSVQWGRGRWLPRGWLRIVKTVVSVVILIALPFTIARMNHTIEVAADGNSYSMESVDAGANVLVNVNGNSVTNLFAFDCAGNPLSGVQLFDQDGEPLEIGETGADDEWMFGVDEDGDEIAIVPNPNTTGGSGWNVFPLLHGEISADYSSVDPSTVEEPEPPFAAVQPLADPDETCAPDDAPAEPGTDTGTQPNTPSEPNAPDEPTEP